MSAFLSKIVVFLLIPLFLVKTCGTGIICVQYMIHKEQIAQTLCVNKDKPKMKCDGKCHLKKQLENEEKKDSSPSGTVKEKSEVQFFSEHGASFHLFNVPIVTEPEVGYSPGLSDSHIQSIFHPPTT